MRKVYAGPEAMAAVDGITGEAALRDQSIMDGRRIWLALVVLADHEPDNRVSVIMFSGYWFQVEKMYGAGSERRYYIGLNHDDRNSGQLREVCIRE